MEALLKIANEEAGRHPEDIDAAVDATMGRAGRTKWFPDMAQVLVRRAVRAMICDCRHATNCAIRRQNGKYGSPAKVTAGKAVGRVAASVYSYMIAGATLGSLLGEELPGIAEDERANAEGHEFNAKLCEALAPLVPDERTVRQCVKEARLKRIFADLS